MALTLHCDLLRQVTLCDPGPCVRQRADGLQVSSGLSETQAAHVVVVARTSVRKWG